MATLIWTEPAVADLEEIGQFIAKDNPAAAEKVGSKIIREAENVAAFPRLGRIVPEFGDPQIREVISQSYRVIYKFDEEFTAEELALEQMYKQFFANSWAPSRRSGGIFSRTND
jgi:toxin ParE1/3/4